MLQTLATSHPMNALDEILAQGMLICSGTKLLATAHGKAKAHKAQSTEGRMTHAE